MGERNITSIEQGIHKINEQLQIIRSSVEHLVMLMDLTDDEKVYFDKIVDAVDRSADILNRDLIAVSNKKVTVDAGSVLRKKGSKILIIEDEQEIAEIYSSNLEYFGFKTYMASNFIDGMKIIGKEDISIVILDIMLPDAYGLDCVDVILAKKPDMKIVVATGKLDELDQDLDHLKNKCTILTKPFSIRALLAAVL